MVYGIARTRGFTSPSPLDLFDSLLSSVRPSLDVVSGFEVCERDGATVLSIDLPGLDPKDIDIKFDEPSDMLTISGFREKKEGDGTTKESSRTYGSFLFSRRIPSAIVDPDGISAKYTNGVLEVTVPMKERKSPRKIDIAVGSTDAQSSISTSSKDSKKETKETKDLAGSTA